MVFTFLGLLGREAERGSGGDVGNGGGRGKGEKGLEDVCI